VEVLAALEGFNHAGTNAAAPLFIRHGRDAALVPKAGPVNDLLQAGKELQSFCDANGWRCCFIGGIAIQRWGEPLALR